MLSEATAKMTQPLRQGGQSERRVAVWVTQEEAEAFLTILVNAPESPHVPTAVAEDLLIRVADARREFTRLEHAASAAIAASHAASHNGS